MSSSCRTVLSNDSFSWQQGEDPLERINELRLHLIKHSSSKFAASKALGVAITKFWVPQPQLPTVVRTIAKHFPLSRCRLRAAVGK